MAITDAAKDDLRHTLRAFRAAHTALAVPTGAGKALEAWVLMKLAVAARSRAGWTVELRRGDDTRLPPGASFDFTAAGSGIRPASLTAPMFVFLEHPDHGAYELHGSLVWKGRSTATHECDVSMIPREVAAALRARTKPAYPRGLPLMIVECKDKTMNANIDEMRQMLARMFDLALVTKPRVGPCRVFEGFTPTRWGRHSSQYRALFRRGLFAVVRSQSFQGGASTLANHYAVRRIKNVYAGAGMGILERGFVTILDEVSTY